jgi:glycosyltransferase involved in cell wall biosynthesis
MTQLAPIKLSICIATFNRAKFIGATLETLISQIGEDVEIVILDGGSTDGTQEVVQRYGHCAQLRYCRQETNNGVDRDFDRAVSLALGEYCWLMSDDDLVKAGAITRILESLRHLPSLVIVNAEVRNHNFSILLEGRRLPFDSDRIYRPDQLDQLFVDTGLYLTFIGCVVIKRQLWIGRPKETYFGSQFIHMGVIFQAMLPHDALVIASVLITIRYGNASWKAREFEIWMFRWPTLVWSLPGLSESAQDSVCPRDSWRRLKTLLLYRAKGAYSRREFRLWLRPRLSFLRGLAPRMIAILPGVLINAAAIAYYKQDQRTAAMTLSDLKNSRYYYRNWMRARRVGTRSN